MHLSRARAGYYSHSASSRSGQRRSRGQPASPQRKTTRVAKRRLAAKGRTVLAVILVGFVLVAAGVIWRRAVGMEQLRELRALELRRLQLDAQRAVLLGEIRDAASRGRIAPIAENRLRMHVAADSQLIFLPRASEIP